MLPSSTFKESNLKHHYKCPELFTYKKEWIPFLEQVKLEINSGKAIYVCHAITDLMVTGQPNRELRALHREIQMSLGGASTISMWSYWNNDEEEENLPKSTKQYRLEWLDRIIERCKDA